MGFSLPVYLHLRHRRSAVVLQLFWLGFAIGLLWEVPIFLSAVFGSEPVVRFLQAPPLHPLFVMVSHAFWDAGLFLIGLALLRLLCGDPVLTRFRGSELAVLLLWGQLSALAVEVGSVLYAGWVYHDGHAWNPVLFRLQGHPVTLLPQLIWLAAPILYYLAASRIVRRAATAPALAQPSGRGA